MKRLLVFLLVCMASTALFAQEHHWTAVTSNETMSATSVVVIDNTEQNNTQLEIGVFCVETGICRSSCFPNSNMLLGHRIYSLAWYGEGDGASHTYTFRLYDHALGMELDVTPPEAIPFVSGQRLGNPRNPYQLVFTSNAQGYTLEIDGYTGEKDHYYLIASPVGAVSASAVEGLRTPDFDFYSFAQDQPQEWINLGGDENENYMLQPGVGYLYANSTGTDLVFTGTPTAETTVAVDLTCAEAAEGLDFPDWNLVGNPFEVAATLDQPFYSMEGGAFVPNDENAILPAMNGAFVVGSAEVTSVSFSKQRGDKAPMLALNLTESGKLVDRAIVGFGKERTLPKFQLFSSTKVYIPQESRDYAVVTAGEMGEMPVSFKAERNGRYTLSFTAQEVSFAYLHLIDNKTGKDVDLLESPAYSFDAQTTDYASRFKLVFATGNNSGDNFAFCSNGNWIISNEGEATLQVVDVTGRILSSETVSGCVSKSISAAPGVYMLRLINGDNMKVQKVVVK